MLSRHLLRLLLVAATGLAAVLLVPGPPSRAQGDQSPEVVAVPIHGELLSVPHTAWIGKEIIFKGTAHDADGDATMTEYKWDFGDGYSTGWVPGVNPYVIEAKHTYTGTMADSTPYGPGKYFTAWLYVKDNTGRIGQDSYFVAIWDVSDPDQMNKAEVNVAIDNGLWWLHKQQIRDTYADGADYGYWDNADYDVATTGAAVEAFELQGHPPKGDPYDITEDPYVETVQRGLNFLFHNAEEVPIGEDPVLCPLGDPDLNGNGIGLAIRGPDGRARMYEAGITLMTMGSSGAPTRVATTGSVTGRTYLDITQDMVEFMAWAQNEHVDYGEFIYRDVDASDDVSPGDVRLRVWWGGGWETVAGTVVQPSDPDLGAVLVPFAAEEKHADPNANGEYEWTEPIYEDLDGSDDVSIGDERLSDVGTYHAGTIVALGDPDLGTALVSFAGDEKHGEDVWDSAYNWTSGRGGWRYGGNYENSDNSVSQWPVIGMEAAERNFGSLDLTVPDFVRPELLLWLEYSQCPEPGWNRGGFGYTFSCGGNVARTGAGAAMLTWVGVPTSDPRFQDALAFLDRAWPYDNFGNYYAMYGVMKGMVIPEPDDVEFIGSHDWYAEYARYIVDEQNTYGGEYVVDHSWLGPDGEGEVQNALATAWAMLILTPTVVLPGPVADAGPDVQDHPPLIAIEFDGSGSYHRDQPIKEIVEYCWDFGDGSPEECSPTPTAEHAYPAVYNPDGTINWSETAEDYVVALRVIDSNVPPLEDADTLVVHITAPPWKPVADADGPYEGWEDIPICLDGSGSYDPESRMYEPGHPWYEEIATYAWDLDNDGLFDDSAVVNPCWTWDMPGTYAVCLRVTDSVPAQDPELDVDVDCATVVVRPLLATPVSIDIKPGSDPNSVNPEKQGIISVAILTTEDFDAATVDPETVVFAGAEPKNYALENVDRKKGDKDIDLVLHFETQETDIAPGNDAACLTGQTYDGTPIIGCDSVRTVLPK